MAVVHKLSERTLDATFSRTPYMLARVDRFPTATFQRGLVEYLDYRFPNLLTFVIVARNEFAPLRLIDLFQSAVGPLRGGVKDGCYLFEGPYVVGYHMGQFRATSISFAEQQEEASQRERIFSSPAGAMRLSASELDALRQFVAYFEPIILRKRRAAGFTEDSSPYSSGYVYETPPGASRRSSSSGSSSSSSGSSSSGSSSTGSGAQPRAAAPIKDDPYVVLGITTTATDDEVKTAYRTQIKLNHPDKVAHLSPALQAFAQTQTLAVNQAYEAILAMRGQRR